jgi:predicted metalloprotease with PDZ domain
MVKEKLDASDQTSFIQQGIPAVQIFSGPHADYHRPTDDIDKIDAAGLVTVATFTKEAMLYLAERETPLSSTTPAVGHGATAGGTRRVSLGTMPDFGYSGTGVKVGAVTPDSPAAVAGIQVGDVLTKLGETEIKSLPDLSDALKKLQPGDEISVVFERDGKVMQAKAKLISR